MADADGESMEVPRETVWRRLYSNNKGAVLILLAEAVGTTMDAIVRFLQQGDIKFHPFQLIFVRMLGTTILSSIYMWWIKVPDFPLGAPRVRGLLVVRALFGFTGLFCLYYAVAYLPLAEVTVLKFLVPIVTASAAAIFLGQVFARKDVIAGLVALCGVIIIAHPSSIFGPARTPSDAAVSVDLAALAKRIGMVSSSQRLVAIAVCLVHVLLASAAYTMIRVIGNRAHALMSVNYFSVLSTLCSGVILLATPGIGFEKPEGTMGWLLLVALGTLGFALQFLLTAGLQLDKTSKATTMMYSHIVFALLFDWGIWRIVPSTWSIVGGGIVMVSTFWAALQKPQNIRDRPAKVPDETSPLLCDEERAESGDTSRE